jgi:uncharacterized protein YgiM (DUF1202 family)
MRYKTIVLLALVPLIAIACTQKPTPVTTEATGSDRPTIAIMYVGVPTMKVYTFPTDTSPLLTSYGYGETVSVLAKKGVWAEIRTVDRSGWVLQADMMTTEDARKFAESTTPRFFKAPAVVPNAGRLHGEIVLRAKVSTSGEVVDVQTLRNTTGSQALEKKNAAALKEAVFYPIKEKGQRLGFFYEHKVAY